MAPSARCAAIIVLAGAALSLAIGSALGQTTPSSVIAVDIGQPAIRKTRPIERSRAALEAETYDPHGIIVGSFKLFPVLELDEVYNDNIYATGDGAAGRTASFIQLVKPSLELRSDWNRHALDIFVSGTLALYGSGSINNYLDFAAGANGRLDISRDNQLAGTISYYRKHDPPGSPDAAVGQTQPSPFDLRTVAFAYLHLVSDISIRVDGRFDRFDWLYNVSGPGQGVILNTDRNRTELREAVRVSYEFLEGYQVWLRAGLNQRRYDNIDALGYGRSSSGWDVVAGFTLDFGGITALEAYAGYVQQHYEDGRLRDLVSPTFGVALYWNPIREVTVKGILRRTVEESILTTASGYLSTAFSAEIVYEFRPNVRVEAFGSYSILDYKPIVGAIDQSDGYFAVGGGFLYYLSPELFVGPRFLYSSRTSTIPGANYNQSLFTLRLGARL